MSERQPGHAVRWLSPGWGWLLAVAGAVVLLGAGLTVTRAQGQTCRDISNITVCADQFDEITANGGGFRLRSNVKIGPKGQPAVVQVDNIGSVFDGSILNENVSTATYFHFNQVDPSTGAKDFLLGDVRMINDPTGLALMGTSVVAVPNRPAGSNEVRVGRIFVDPINRKIFNPAAGAVPIFAQEGITRNANIRLAFLSRVGALSFYKDGGSVSALSTVDGEFDLTAKTFKGLVPIDLKLSQQAENPNLRITMRATFSNTGAFSGTVDGFKLALAGLIMDASGVTMSAASGSTPASFQAALIKVLKSDNQDVPTLDPTDASLIFSFTNLKYKQGAFEIGGIEVPVNDWEFGNAFKMVGQTLGIVNENNVQSLQIKSTLTFFGNDGDPARKLPIILKIGRSEVSPGTFKPVFAAGLQNISPKIGTFTFKLQGAVFSGSAAENFWGIKANTAALQWPSYLGGQTAAGVSNFRLGISLDANKNKKFAVALGNGTLSLPPFENKVFRGSLGATVGVVNETMVMTGTGNFSLVLPNSGNSAGVATTAVLRYGKPILASDPPVPPSSGTICRRNNLPITCPTGLPPASGSNKEFELKLAGFNLKIAGFGMTVTSPRGLDDGGFAADNVAATLPTGIAFDNIGGGTDTNGISIQGLAVSGSGDIQIAGGGFEIAPIKFGGYQFVGLKGVFVKLPTGGFEFKAGGKLPLPGIEPGANGGGIAAEVRIRTKPNNSVDGFGVTVTFTAGGVIPKIKLPGTGMSITTISGSFDLSAGTSTITIAVKATSDLALPLGNLGSLPLVTAQGNLAVQPPPNFRMSANASLSVLIFQVATASVNLGQGYGFNGGAGMDISFTVNTLLINGAAHLKVGEVTLSDGTKKVRVQGDASLSLIVPKKIFAGLPLEDKPLASVTVGFGQYKDTKNNNRQTAGLLAMGTLNIIGTVGGFLDMGTQPVNLIFFKDPSRFQQVTAAMVHQRAMAGVAGYSSRMASLDAQGTLAADDVVPYTLANTSRLLMGIEYTGTLSLTNISVVLPDNTLLTPASVNGTTQVYGAESNAAGGVLLFVLYGAAPGTYQLRITNPPTDYTANALELDEMPTGSVTADTCAGPSFAGVAMTCSGGGSDLGRVNISWSAADIDSPAATVDVGYVRVESGVADNTNFTVLTSGQPLGGGSLVWELDEVPTGSYRVMIEVSNTNGPAVRAYGSQLITVADTRAPATPTGVTGKSLANELSITWTQNSEHDLAGYEIGMGIVEPGQPDSVDTFFYTRSMGPKDLVVGSASLVDGKLWGIPDGVTVFYALRAYDASGNYSAWTAIQRGSPWALSPNTWTPVPGGTGTYLVEVAFDTPMQADTLRGALTVRDATGTTVPGTTYLLSDDSGEHIIGVGFEAANLLRGAYSATLAGGATGAQAVDGRTMGGNYSWSLTIEPYTVNLPLVRR